MTTARSPQPRVIERREVRRAAPHWLYRLFDADGVLLYVGQTSDPVQRFRQWVGYARRTPDLYGWFRHVVRCDWQQFPNWDAVVGAEKRAIETERPKHNIYHQPKRVA